MPSSAHMMCSYASSSLLTFYERCFPYRLRCYLITGTLNVACNREHSKCIIVSGDATVTQTPLSRDHPEQEFYKLQPANKTDHLLQTCQLIHTVLYGCMSIGNAQKHRQASAFSTGRTEEPASVNCHTCSEPGKETPATRPAPVYNPCSCRL